MKQKTAILSKKQFLHCSRKRIISLILALFMLFSATYQTDLFLVPVSAAEVTKISDIISFKQNYNLEASEGSIVDLTPVLPDGIKLVDELSAKKSTSITEIKISFKVEREANDNVFNTSYRKADNKIDSLHINYVFSKDPYLVIGKKYQVEAEVSANNGTTRTFTFNVTIVDAKDASEKDAKAREISDSITYPSVITIFPDSINGRTANVFPTAKNGVAVSTASDLQTNSDGALTTVGFQLSSVTNHDESILSVNWSTGDVKYVYSGNVSKVDGFENVCEIKVYGDNGGVFSYTVTVRVQSAFAVFEDSTPSLLEVGEKSQAMLRVSPDYRDITWESSDPAVLKVSRNADKSTAKLTAKKSGSATITAYVTNDRELITVSRTYLVNVAPPAPKISITSAALKKGEAINLYINNLPDKATVTYSTSKSSVASVGKTTGKVTAKAAGTATITATVKVPANGAVKAATYKLKCKVTVTTATVKNISTAKQLRTALTSGKGGSYKLTKNINLGKTGIEIKSGAYRLNLNGYKITGATVDSYALILIKGGSLVLTDSKGKGVIKNTGEWPAVLNDGSTFTMYGGTLSGDTQAFQCFGTSSKSTINGGKLTANNMVIIPSAGKLTVNYAELTAGSDPDYYSSCFASASDKLKLTINGGKFKGETGIDCTGDFASIVINGGTFDTQYYTAIINSAELAVNGGKMNNGIIMDEWLFAEDVPRLTINNCDIQTVYSCPIQIFGSTNLTLNGGRLENLSITSDEKLNIDQDFNGVKNIAEGMLLKNEILDATPEGQGITVTSFNRNKTKYSKGMHITKPNDLYSVWMDIFENLYTDVSFTCTPSMEALMDYYLVDWIIADKIGTVFRDQVPALDKISVDATITYDLSYMIRRLGEKPALKSRASKEAVAYSKKLDAIIKSCIKSGMTDKEKIIALHDYMIEHYSYDYSYNQESFSYLGLIDNSTGVCQAFATMLVELATRCGIKAGTVTGYAGNSGSTLGAHMWNCVKINGKIYYIDVTFDENFTTGKKPSRHFCLLSENDFYNLGYHPIVFKEEWR